MREVKEIRVGKCSKDFDRWPEEAKKLENLRCFIVFYGLEFKLKSLSIGGNILLASRFVFCLMYSLFVNDKILLFT